MLKKFSLVFCLCLTACGGDSQHKPISEHVCDINSVQLHISQNSDLLQLENESFVFLTVSGNLNNITVNKNYKLCKLTVTGSGNLIKIESQFIPHQHPEIIMSGSDNSIQVLDMQNLDIGDTGSANQVYKF